MVKILGVAHLLYMAWTTWRTESTLEADPGGSSSRSARHVVTSAVLLNLLNPKLTMFFFAFLPQFVREDSPHALATLLGLSAVFMLMTFAVFTVYGLLASTARSRLLARPRFVTRLRRAFALSFLALGAKLATTTRT